MAGVTSLVGWGMDIIEGLNQAWEARLTPDVAQLWLRMKALGVTAEWQDPAPGHEIYFTEELNGIERRVERSELFRFVVSFQGREIDVVTKHSADYDAVSLTTIITAANELESQGYRVMPS
jgi:hypothetical protein